jgi:hypothetical protein
MKRVGRYSFVRYRLWTEKDVNDLYNMAFKSGAGKSSEQQHPGDVVNHAETDV